MCILSQLIFKVVHFTIANDRKYQLHSNVRHIKTNSFFSGMINLQIFLATFFYSKEYSLIYFMIDDRLFVLIRHLGLNSKNEINAQCIARIMYSELNQKCFENVQKGMLSIDFDIFFCQERQKFQAKEFH